MRPSFIYYLFDKNRAPLYVDGNGHVLTGDPGNYFKPDGQPARLKHAPDGWKDTLVKYARNIKYWGLFRDYSVPMNFVGDGRRILRDQFYKYGAEAIVYLGIAKLDRSSVPYNYTAWYMSELDFTKYEETKTGIKIMAVEGGLTKFIKANENTVYEIPIDTDLEKVFIKHDGLVIENSANYYVNNGVVPDHDFGQHTLEAMITTSESASLGAFSSVRKYFADNTELLANELYFLRTGDYVSDVRFQFDFGFTCDLAPAIPNLPNAGGRLLVTAFDDNDVATDAWVIQDYGGSSNMYQHHQLTGDVTISNVPANRRLFICQFATIGGVIASGAASDEATSWTYDNDEADYLKITYRSRFKTTYIAGLYPYRVLEVLLNKMTGGLYTVNSPWLEAMRDIILTSGNAVRGIRYIDTLVPNSIKTSLSDFYQWLKSREAENKSSVGLTVVNDQLVIDQLKNFFTDDVITDLGGVDDIVITHAEDISFNTIKAGYKQQEYNDVNGKYEFNQGQQWTTPKTRNVKEFDIVSPFRADPIGIELLRINYENLNTTDAKDDNDVFAFNVETVSLVLEQEVEFFAAGNYMTNPGGFPFTAGNLVRVTGTAGNNKDFPVVAVGTNIVQFDTSVLVTDEAAVAATITFLQGGIFELNRPTFSSLSGIPATMEDSIYNVLLSPKTNLLNNGGLIHPDLDLMDDQLVKFQSADQNAELSYTLAGNTVTEKEDIQIGSLATKLFKPYYLALRTKVPLNVIELINANPFGRVQFSVYGETYYGFLWDGGVAPAKAGKDNDAQTWKLLSAPDNNLKDIYNY